jgi:ABC-type sugar transport system ATPase subunit
LEHFLALENLTLSYSGNTIIDSIDLTLERGKFLGLRGSNGSGKTTLLKALAGELKPSSGNIWFEGKNILNSNIIQRIKMGIIYLHQFPIVFPDLFAWETFNLWNSAIQETSFALVDQQKTIEYLQGRLKKIPLDNDMFEKKVSRLTQAELQILEFSRFFLTEAKLVLIDEATSVLDFGLANKIVKFLKEFTVSGGTVIFVSHRISEITKYADHVYSLENKKIRLFLPQQKKIPDEPFTKRRDSKSRPKVVKDTSIGSIDIPMGNNQENLRIDMYSNQIIGISGLDGPKYESISKNIFKALLQKRNDSGAPFVVGRDFAFLGKNRTTDWVFEGQTVEFNLSIAHQGFFTTDLETSRMDDLVAYYQISPNNKEILVDKLSGGNKLKTAIGRTLSLKCPINILDEPFTGIDESSREAIIEIIIEETTTNNSMFIILSKDYVELLKFCDTLFAVSNQGSYKKIHPPNIIGISSSIEELLFGSNRN